VPGAVGECRAIAHPSFGLTGLWVEIATFAFVSGVLVDASTTVIHRYRYPRKGLAVLAMMVMSWGPTLRLNNSATPFAERYVDEPNSIVIARTAGRISAVVLT